MVLVLVQVAGIVVVSMAVQIDLRPATSRASRAPATRDAEWAAPRSAFASYASANAGEVAARLSTLARWAPGLDIFQDRLDLAPNQVFKAQLERQIAVRDAFPAPLVASGDVALGTRGVGNSAGEAGAASAAGDLGDAAR